MIATFFRSFTHELTLAFNPKEWMTLGGQLRKMTPARFLAALKKLAPEMFLYYLLLSPVVAAPIYNTMLFHPTMTGPFGAHQIAGHKIENVSFQSANGTRLHGWFVPVPGARRVVLLSHGNGGNLTHRIPLIAMLLRSGVSVFIYDYQGYGRSAGNPSVDRICEDGLAAYDFLVANKGYRGADVIAFGESVGSGVACEIAAWREVGGIILQSPYTSLRELAQYKLPLMKLYPAWLFPQRQLDNAAVLSRTHAPALLVHGQRDRIIPFAMSEELAASASPQISLAVLPDAGHNDIYDVNNQLYGGALREFFQNLK